MRRLDLHTIGGPGPHKRLHRVRAVAAVVAALAGGFAAFAATVAIVGGVMPADSPAAWLGIAVLLMVCLTGLWWRWDAPDARESHFERERRGF